MVKPDSGSSVGNSVSSNEQLNRFSIKAFFTIDDFIEAIANRLNKRFI